MGARRFEPVRLPSARPDELVYSLLEGDGEPNNEAGKPTNRRSARRRLPKRPVSQAEREMADNAIRNGTVKVTRCAPGYSAHILPRILKEL